MVEVLKQTTEKIKLTQWGKVEIIRFSKGDKVENYSIIFSRGSIAESDYDDNDSTSTMAKITPKQLKELYSVLQELVELR